MFNRPIWNWHCCTNRNEWILLSVAYSNQPFTMSINTLLIKRLNEMDAFSKFCHNNIQNNFWFLCFFSVPSGCNWLWRILVIHMNFEYNNLAHFSCHHHIVVWIWLQRTIIVECFLLSALRFVHLNNRVNNQSFEPFHSIPNTNSHPTEFWRAFLFAIQQQKVSSRCYNYYVHLPIYLDVKYADSSRNMLSLVGSWKYTLNKMFGA